MKLRIRSLTCVALLAAQLVTGCTSWQVMDVSPRALVDDPHIKRIRVLEKGGATIILDAPAVSGDSLMGKVTLWTPAKGATVGVAYIAGTNLSISLAAVDNVAVRKPNSTATIGLAVGIIGVIVAISAAATSSALSRGFGCFTCDNSWP